MQPSHRVSSRAHRDAPVWSSCCVPYCGAQIERFPLGDVKRVMIRMRLVLVSLLPALVLFANEHYCLGSTMVGASDCCPPFILAGKQGTRLPVQYSCSFERSARGSSRRAGVDSGPNGFAPFSAAPDSVLCKFLPADISLTVCRIPAGLARSWQFHWRTALEPRAPSSVS